MRDAVAVEIEAGQGHEVHGRRIEDGLLIQAMLRSRNRRDWDLRGLVWEACVAARGSTPRATRQFPQTWFGLTSGLCIRYTLSMVDAD